MLRPVRVFHLIINYCHNKLSSMSVFTKTRTPIYLFLFKYFLETKIFFLNTLIFTKVKKKKLKNTVFTHPYNIKNINSLLRNLEDDTEIDKIEYKTFKKYKTHLKFPPFINTIFLIITNFTCLYPIKVLANPLSKTLNLY